MSNRLSKETSPYLLQHKNNPVDWYPWGDEALSRSRRENKPILLSIGYSACHWCHVMEHESFENSEIARLMNENFISIKVDREERPDLDHIYQKVAQAMTRGGGWPLTVFLTPDLKPFFGGTYFPPDDRYGRPGFGRVLMALSKAYQENTADVQENAKNLTEYIANVEILPETQPRRPLEQDFKIAASDLMSHLDWTHGGLGGAPKFPNAMTFSYLWRYGVGARDIKAQEATLLTLSQMASGGIYDQLGGGFHRYAVDATWSVPHFEKMLYDNGLLLKLFAEVLLTQEQTVLEVDQPLYLHVLQQTVGYVLREMTSPEGVFYSSQDADSEGEEGKFFVWDLSDLSEHLTKDEARIFALRYGVTEQGNFEENKTVLFLNKNLEEVSQITNQSQAQVMDLLNAAHGKLWKVRTQRIAPGRDDKILASWNGLMISGLSWAAQAFRALGQLEDAKRAHDAATRAFQFLVEKMAVDGHRLASTFQGGKAKGQGFLDDYAFLAMAALDLSRFTENTEEVEKYLKDSSHWIEIILKHFRDPHSPGYFFTSDDHEKLIQRPKTVFDQAIPSGTSVALNCMVALAELGFDQYRSEAESQLAALFQMAGKHPQGSGELLCASYLHVQGPITVSGTSLESKGSSLCFHPHVFQKPTPIEQGKVFLVCHQNTCSQPYQNLGEARLKVVSTLLKP